MQKNGLLAYLTALLLGAILAAVAMLVYQFSNIENRQIEQAGQIRDLGQSADQLRGAVQQLQTTLQTASLRAPAPSSQSPLPSSQSPLLAGGAGGPTSPTLVSASGRHWLHPEVANFLQPNDFQITAPTASMNGTLTRPYGVGQIKGFNILTENAADVQDLWSYVGESLANRMAWTDPDRYSGQIAERVEITDHYKEYTIYLRHGIKWQQPGCIDLNDPKYAWLRGDHYLTAHDVKFTLDMMMNPQVQNSALRNYYQDLESWKVIDDYTIVIRWKKTLYTSIESTLSLSIIPEFLYAYDENGKHYSDETIGMNFNNHWYASKGLVGSGPYRMVSYTPGGQLRLERNEDYYDVHPAIKTILFLMYDDPNLTLLKLKAHELNYGGLTPGQAWDEILKYQQPNQSPPSDSVFFNGNILNKRLPGMGFSYIGWNMNKPMFQDKRVRQAMTYAFDRPEILARVFHGLGQLVAADAYIGSPYYDHSLQPYPFDLKKAAELLKEAGWADTDGDGILDKNLNPNDPNAKRQPFVFSLLIYSGSPEWDATSQIFRDDLLKIGVKMNIESADWAHMQQKMDEKSFDAYTGGWGLSWDYDGYQLWYSGEADQPKSSNYVGFRNKEADEIILKLRTTFDRNERVQLVHRFEQILNDEQPYTFFRQPEIIDCWWDEVKRVIFAKISPESGYSLPWYVETK